MKNIILFLSFITLSQGAFAECEDFYAKKINEISGRMNPPRATIMINLGAEAVLVSTLAAAGTLTVGSVVALPAAAVGAGGYLAALAAKRASLNKAYLSLKQARIGEGPIYRKLVKMIKRKNPEAQPEDIRHAILRLNSEEALCIANHRNGKVKVVGFRKMAKMVREEL